MLLGGPLGDYFQALCDPAWSIDVIPIAQNTRINISLLVQDPQTALKINEEGPELSHHEVESVLDYLGRHCNRGTGSRSAAPPRQASTRTSS